MVGCGFLLMSLIGCGAEQQTLEELGVTHREHVYDAGMVRTGSTIEHTFKVYNTTNHPILMERIEKTCQCTHADLKGEAPLRVAPGEFAEASVEVETFSKHGPMEISMRVVTDAKDKEHRMIDLKVLADVYKPAEATPEKVEFGVVDPESVDARLVQVELLVPGLQKGKVDLHIDDDQYIEAKIVEQVPERLVVMVRLRNEKTAGQFYTQLRLKFDDPDFPELAIPIIGRVKGALQAIPQSIQIIKDSSIGQQQVLIKSYDGKKFRIKSIETPEGIELTDEDADTPRKEHYLTVNTKSNSVGGNPRYVTRYITLRTDHPDQAKMLLLAQYSL